MNRFRRHIDGRELLDGMAVPAVAGLAVGASMVAPFLAPVQLPALAALGWSLRGATGVAGRLRPGFWFGATMAALVLFVTGVPQSVAMVLFLALASYWMVLGACIAGRLAAGGWPGWLGAVAMLTLGEFAQIRVLPMFGTAQRFSSAWADYDAMLLLARCGGTLAVSAFVAATAFAWVLRDGLSRRVRAAVWLAGGFVIGAGWTLGAASWGEREVTIAVCGEKSNHERGLEAFLRFYGPMVADAAASGARVVVTPEMALFLTSAERDAALARVEAEAKRLGVCWVLGFAQYGPSANRAVVLNASGGGVFYDKTHWVPKMENYARHGDGLPVFAEAKTGPAATARVGVMICQDDNFEDVAAGLSRACVDIVAVPTLDWAGVEYAHLNSARNRPRDFRYVEARAAVGGISAIIDRHGRVVASRNHLAEGEGYALATVSLPAPAPSVFARVGPYALPVAAAAALALALAAGRRRRNCEVTGK